MYGLHCRSLLTCSSSLEGSLRRDSPAELLTHPERRFLGRNRAAVWDARADAGGVYPDLAVIVQLYSGAQPLSLPNRTSYHAFRHSFQWLEWMQLPFRISDLPLNARLAFTVV